MTRYHTWFRVFAAATCGLTFLAGADDFNLARVLLPLPAPVPDSPLPLDDPNSDFTEPAEAPSLTAGHAVRSGPPVPAARRPTRRRIRTLVPTPAPAPSLRARIDVPLRC